MGKTDTTPLSGEIFLGRSSSVQARYKRPDEIFWVTDLWSSNTMLVSICFSSIMLRGVKYVPQCVNSEHEHEAILLKV